MSENRARGLEVAFYQRLLDLSGPEEAERLLGRAIELLARLTGAELAYLEILDLGDELRLGCSAAGPAVAVDEVRARIAPEIARCVAGRIEPIVTASAIDDERLRELESVRWGRIRAVLCVPLEPIAGALYLQGPAPFSPVELEHATLCARQIGEQLLRRHDLGDRLSLRRAMHLYQRRHVLAALERTGWNIAAASRELAVARSHLYKLMASLELRRAAAGHQCVLDPGQHSPDEVSSIEDTSSYL